MQNKENNQGQGTQGMGNSSHEKPSKGNTSKRGFASMDYQKQREIASKGGKAAHLSGNAHEFTSEEAREAGRKGGQARNANRMKAAGKDQG